MTAHVFIAAHSPWDGPEHELVFEQASTLAAARGTVSVYLTRAGVMAARIGSGERWIRPLLSAGVRVFVDPLALAERGIGRERVLRGVVTTPLEKLLAGLRID